jgi:hypothetical protein
VSIFRRCYDPICDRIFKLLSDSALRPQNVHNTPTHSHTNTLTHSHHTTHSHSHTHTPATAYWRYSAPGRRRKAESRLNQRQHQRQRLYSCTSKASKVGTLLSLELETPCVDGTPRVICTGASVFVLLSQQSKHFCTSRASTFVPAEQALLYQQSKHSSSSKAHTLRRRKAESHLNRRWS